MNAPPTIEWPRATATAAPGPVSPAFWTERGDSKPEGATVASSKRLGQVTRTLAALKAAGPHGVTSLDVASWAFRLAAYTFARETGDAKGSHVHILLHLPPALAPSFFAMQRGWLRRVTGRPYRAGVLLSRAIAGARDCPLQGSERYRVNLVKLINYQRKGAPLGVAATIGQTTFEPTYQGCIIGKRAGWSQNLGVAARRRFAEAEADRRGADTRPDADAIGTTTGHFANDCG